MAEPLYRILSLAFQHLIWGGELEGGEKLPAHGPAVLVGNHLGSLGPIAAAASLPVRLHPWIVSAMLDPVIAPNYLRRDFVEKDFHLHPPVSLWISKAVCKISVPLLNSIGCVPVYPNPDGLRVTIQQSLELLLEDAFLIVFPEDPTMPIEPRYGMAPFKKGFTWLGELYYQSTGRSLNFYPLAVHATRRVVKVGDPIRYHPFSSPVEERSRIRKVLEGMIHEMVLGMDAGDYLGVPLTR